MVLPSFVKLILCGTLAGAVGSLLGGLPTISRGALLTLLLTLAVLVLKLCPRRAQEEEDGPPLLLVSTLVCGLVVGLILALADRWLDVRLPYDLAAAHIPGWAQDLSAMLFGVLVLVAYRLRLRSPGWQRAMPFLVWAGAAVADGVRFLPLIARAPSFAVPAFLGGVANASVLVFGWLLALKLHDPQYDPFPEEEDERGTARRRLARFAVRALSVTVALVCAAFLFARQVGFAHAWYTTVVWNHPELVARVPGRLYSAPATPGERDQLDLICTNPDESWPALLERSSRGDAVLLGDIVIVAEPTAVRGWNLKTGETVIEFRMEWASLALSPDGTLLACVGNLEGDPVDALRLAILQTEDGTMIEDLSPGFQRQGVCWTADGKQVVGVVGTGEETHLVTTRKNGQAGIALWPGTRPHLDPTTGEILYLHEGTLWRRAIGSDEPQQVAPHMAGVTDYRLTSDPEILMVARERLHRFGAPRHYLLALDLAAPDRRHVLSARHIPPWCLWEP